MANIQLLALDQIAWTQVAEDPGVFAIEQDLTLGVEPDLLRSVGQQTVAMLQRTQATPPWTGYLAVDRSRNIIVGTCAFTAPPDAEGIVEIAYFTFPPFEGRGHATAMAAGLMELAEAATTIRKVRAHTLPERNASTRVLQKLGFDRIGDAVDAEVGRVWRWETVFTTLLALLVFLAAASQAAAATKVIRFGKLIDGTGRVITNAVVIVEDDRIQRVASGNVPIPPGAEVIDLSRYTGMPGLIDAHTHITYYWDGVTTPRSEPARHPAVVAVLAQENGMKALEAGVTTIRDLNAANGVDLAMRDLINMGKMTGPRMFVSGPALMITRSTAPPAPIGILADGVDGVLRAVRQVIASGADWVKMRGSTGGFDDVTQFQTFTFEEMKAAVDAAHALGKKVAIHSYGPGGARDAVRAGVDSLEHGADLDEDTIAEMVRRNTYYSPTIDHNQYYIENADTVYHFPADAKERLRDYIRRNADTAQKAFRAGVRIMMGSDAVYNGWGLNTRELDWFVKIGMTPEQALRAATTTPAAMLGMEKSLGAVAPGFLADLVAVEGDPLADITAISKRENVRWVMKGGQTVVDKTKRTAN